MTNNIAVSKELSRLEEYYKKSCLPFTVEFRDMESISIDECSDLIKVDPSAENFVLRGLKYRDAGRYDLAIRDYDEAISRDQNSPAYNHKVRAYFSLKDINGVTDSLEELLHKEINNLNYLLDKHNNIESEEFYDEYEEIIDIKFDAMFDILFSLYTLSEDSKKIEDYIEKYSFLFDKKQPLLILARALDHTINDKNEKNKNLKIKEKELEEEKKRNTSLVQRYSHTLSNTIFPQTLYNIAERIKGNVQLKKDALLLHDAYNAEISIILENELLQQRYASSNPETLRQSVRGDRLPVTDPHAHSIQDILDYALRRVLTRFLNQNHAKSESVRDRVINSTGHTLDDLRHNFEDALFFSDTPQTAIGWCDSNLRPIEFHFSSPIWKNVGIRQEGLSEAMLYGHFAEILFNAFKYADHQSDWFLRIDFGEWEDDAMKYLTISWENPLTTESIALLGSGKGLESVSEDLQQLNDKISPEHTLLIEKSEGCFKLNLCYQADLLLSSSLPKIDVGSFFLNGKKFVEPK